MLGTAVATLSLFSYFYFTDTRASIHRWLVVPILRRLYEDEESAHEAGVGALKVLYPFGLHPRERGDSDKASGLEIEVFGQTLRNPVGTSAGIDKGAEVPDQLLALGSAYVEVGGITPLPQEGNPRPRLFRMVSQSALVNRFGLNSEGADRVAMRLRKRVREYACSMSYGIDEAAEQKVLDGAAGVPPGSLVKGKLLAIQIAKNKITPNDDIESIERDYVYCVEKLAKYADAIVVNVSSPNTENLRDLQRQEPLTKILMGVVNAAAKTDRKTKPAVMVKVSPDEDSEEQLLGICQAIWASGVDGVIVGNTTKRRPHPLPAGIKLSEKEAAVMLEQGGYSGPQLFERTVKLVKRYRRMLDQNLGPPIDGDNSSLINSNDTFPQPLIRLPERHKSLSTDASGTFDANAVPNSNSIEQAYDTDTLVSSSARKPGQKVIFCSGGISNGKQALELLQAGANLIQIYTA